MNENIDLSLYTISIRIGNSVEYLSLDTFTTFCDKFLFEEICDLLAQSPLSTVIYSGFRNKVKFVLQIYHKEN